MNPFKVGDRVAFHWKMTTTIVTGTVAAVDVLGPGDLAVQLDVDGKIIELERIEHVHAANATLLAPSPEEKEKQARAIVEAAGYPPDAAAAIVTREGADTILAPAPPEPEPPAPAVDGEREIRKSQNPAVGAALLCSFARAYQRNHPEASGPALPFVFLVLPILLYQATFEAVVGTRTNLRGFAEKFSSSASTSDILLGIARRSRDMRDLTSESVAISLSAGLAGINASNGTFVASKAVEEIPEGLVDGQFLRAAQKLGQWFSELNASEVARTLRVTF
jgi:hypothetical protein